jgi:hypothetical protein
MNLTLIMSKYIKRFSETYYSLNFDLIRRINLFGSLCFLFFSIQSCTNPKTESTNEQTVITDQSIYFEKDKEEIIKNLVSGHWLFVGREGNLSSDESHKQTFQIEFFIQNDSLRYKSNLNTVGGGMVDVENDIYVRPDLTSNLYEGIVLITDSNGVITLTLNDLSGSLFKKFFIEIPGEYKDYIGKLPNGTTWDYLNAANTYEKMILAKEGSNLNQKERNSFIFISMFENNNWSQDFSELYIFRGVEDLYNFKHVKFYIENNSDLGYGYKIFVPNQTKYDKGFNYKALNEIMLKKESDESGQEEETGYTQTEEDYL